MTSSSIERGRGSSTRALAPAVTLAAALAAGSCRNQTVSETPVSLTFNNNGGRCVSLDGQALGDMDTYVVQTFKVNVDELSFTQISQSPCQNCLVNGDLCLPQPPVCFCGGPTAATPDAIQGALKGQRVPNVDSNYLYCMRVLALNVGKLGLERDAPTHPCDCGPDWEAYVADGSPMCALSRSAVGISKAEFMLDVRCPATATFRNGFTQTVPSSQFTSCIAFPPGGDR
jgi:hypothetical protein